MARQSITIPGPPEQVYIVQFKDTGKTRWLVVDGDPTDRNWRNNLGCVKLHKRCTQVGETFYSGGSGADISAIREVANSFADWREERRPVNVEVAPDDKVAVQS
jgi:hypothetical protein